MLGRKIETELGPVRLALIYLCSLLAGSAFVLAFNFNSPTLGASGGVLGLAGGIAGWSIFLKRPLNEIPMLSLIALNLALPLIAPSVGLPSISFWGHLGGIVGGCIAGWLLIAISVTYKNKILANSVVAIVCVGWFVIAVVIARSGGVFELL